MKTIKVAFYKVELLNINKQPSLPSDDFEDIYTFEGLLKSLASRLDGDTHKQVIDINNNGQETSIWFDCFNHQKEFNFESRYYFLLAKDVKSIMKEDKKENKLAHQESIKDDIHLKIPSHFVYFPENEILGVEELDDAPTKTIIKKAIKEHTKIDVKFNPINRTNLLERLNDFQEAIEGVEFDLKDFSSLVKSSDGDEFMEFLRTNQSKLKIKTFLETDKSKNFVIDVFSKLIQKKVENDILKQIKNMKVLYKNEHQKQEAIELIENFLVFKADREFEYEDFNEIEDEVTKRLKYSKSIYETIIGFYDEYFNS